MGISAEKLMNDPAGSGRPSVVFTDQTIGREALDLLAPTCHVRVLTAYPSENELVKACGDANGILARLGRISTRVIDSAPHLRIIARHGVGVDAVDLEAATRRGVVVTTTGFDFEKKRWPPMSNMKSL